MSATNEKCRDLRGKYMCDRPAGHDGDHWQTAVIASWEPEPVEPEPEIVQAKVVWRIWRNSDFTEGRGRMVPTSEMYDSENAAWNALGDRPGVMGSQPQRFTWTKHPVKTWREFHRVQGYGGDWDVRRELQELEGGEST